MHRGQKPTITLTIVLNKVSQSVINDNPSAVIDVKGCKPCLMSALQMLCSNITKGL